MPSRRTLEEMGVGAGHTVLELGPGPGYFSVEAVRLAGPGGRLVCLDIQRAMLEILGKRLLEAGAPAGLITGDGMQLPFCEDAFDRVFLVTVLGEIPDMGVALREIKRVLRPGGVLGLSETFLDPDYVTEGTLRRVCAEAGLDFAFFRRHIHGYITSLRKPVR